MKLMMIYFKLPRKNPGLQWILTDHYIKRYGNGMAYIIVGKQAVDKVQKTLMGLTNNSSVSLLTSQHLQYFCQNFFSIKSF